MTKNGVWAESVYRFNGSSTNMRENHLFFFSKITNCFPPILRTAISFLSLHTVTHIYTKSTICILKNVWKPLLNTDHWLASFTRVAGNNAQWEKRLRNFIQWERLLSTWSRPIEKRKVNEVWLESFKLCVCLWK